MFCLQFQQYSLRIRQINNVLKLLEIQHGSKILYFKKESCWNDLEYFRFSD